MGSGDLAAKTFLKYKESIMRTRKEVTLGSSCTLEVKVKFFSFFFMILEQAEELNHKN